MNTNFEIIAGALSKLIDGDPLPSFRSAEFADIMSAAGSIAGTPGGLDYERLGRRTTMLLVQRLVASMTAERELALMRDNSRPPC